MIKAQISKKFYQNDSIRFGLAPLRAERRNHRSSTAGLQGAVRPSSCWAHSGTGGAAGPGAEMKRGMSSTWRTQPRPSHRQTTFLPRTHRLAPGATFLRLHYQLPQPVCLFKTYSEDVRKQASSLLLTHQTHARLSALDLLLPLSGMFSPYLLLLLFKYYFFSKACLKLQPSPSQLLFTYIIIALISLKCRI